MVIYSTVMTPALTTRQWIIIGLVNVVISAVTTLIVVRVLMNTSTPNLATTASIAVVTNTPQAKQAETVSPIPTQTKAPPAKATPTPTRSLSPSATPLKAPAQTATQTDASGTAASAGQVRIGRVLFPGQRQRETVVIANDSNNDVLLQGWVLSSNRNISYTFGNVTLFRNNFINLHTTSGSDVPTDLFWNKVDPAWQVGDVLTLANQAGQVISTYTVTNH